MKKIEELISDLCCPSQVCRSNLELTNMGIKCSNTSCVHNNESDYFPLHNQTPVLISEKCCDTLSSSFQINSYIPRRETKLIDSLRNFLVPDNKVSHKNCLKFIELLTSNQTQKRKVLIIGSGTKGNGSDNLYLNDEVIIYGTDVYFSSTVDAISDAHYLPFKENFFDGVWIQAVLEHVVEPKVVVDEIERILKDDGIVYAETPFMQQVHEGAYDFNRFTLLGHRYLFKSFEAIEIGKTKGAGESLAWSIRYFFLALFRSKKIATVLTLPFLIILNFLENFLDKRSDFDSSSGVFFLGKKNNFKLTHKDIIKLYQGMI